MYSIFYSNCKVGSIEYRTCQITNHIFLNILYVIMIKLKNKYCYTRDLNKLKNNDKVYYKTIT